MDSVLKKSLVNMYLVSCREISGNEQIPVNFSRSEKMYKYNPDRVQDYFIKDSANHGHQSLEVEFSNDEKKNIQSNFLQSSLWLSH